MNFKIIWIASFDFYLDYTIQLRIHLICPIFFYFSYSFELEGNHFAFIAIEYQAFRQLMLILPFATHPQILSAAFMKYK